MKRRIWFASTTITVLLGVSLFEPRLPASVAGATPPAPQGDLAVEYLKAQRLFDSLQEAVAAAHYSVYEKTTAADTEWVADNPAQQLRAHFMPTGLQIDSRGDGRAHRFGMRLRSAGYGERQIPALPGRRTASGARAEIRHELQSGEFSGTPSHVIEWYHNRAEGLEQGFTLESAPGQRQDGERLRVVLGVSGELRAKAVDDGQALEFEDADGRSVLRYDHLVVTDDDGRELPARMAVSEGEDEIWLEVDDRGAVWPVTIDPTFTHQQSLLPSGAAALSQFGLSVAISGETAVVGARDITWVPCTPQSPFDLSCFFEPHQFVSTGSAYVFVRSNGGWMQQQKLVPSDGGPGDGFGSAVAITGDRIVVGAPGRESAYVFERTGGAWSERHKLQPKTTAFLDLFGSSVAISRDAIVVGAPRKDQRSLADTGAAYVFENSGGAWIQQELVNQPSGAGDLFGYSVAISGDVLVVGAPIDDSHGTTAVFTRSGGVWIWQGTLAATDASAGDGFGISVALGGSTVVVGAPGDDEFSLADTGSVYVFTGRSGIWSQQQKIVNPYSAADDQFGASVAISGGMFVVGTPNDDLFGTPRHGTAVVFESIGEVWREHQWFLFAIASPWPICCIETSFGRSVAMSGGTVVVGAPSVFLGFPGYATLAGSAHVFATNTRPTIQAATVQSPPPFVVNRAVIGTGSDQQDHHNALTVTVNGAASATVNGVTVSAISVDPWGTITADVVAVSANSNASFVLRVTDTTGLFAEATLVVRNLVLFGGLPTP